ncbi:MAG: hypothetical protein AAGD14_06100 [Planctomycetota bacterium]
MRRWIPHATRWAWYLFGFVLTPIAGLVVSEPLAHWAGVWVFDVASVWLPIFGLGYAWLVAPRFKGVAVAVYLVFGLVLATMVACPASYPEWHPRAYQTTYRPYVATIVTSLVVTFLIAVRLAWTAEPDDDY